jgi:hypothetical protein
MALGIVGIRFSCFPDSPLLTYVNTIDNRETHLYARKGFTGTWKQQQETQPERSNPLKESSIERRFAIEAKKRGGLAAKFVSPGLDGVPDRITLLPGGKMAFVELKAPGKTLRPLQALRMEQLEGLGFRVFVVDGPEQIGVVLDAIQSA